MSEQNAKNTVMVMYTNLQLRILQLLFSSSEKAILQSEALADKLSVSSKTIKTEMSKLRSIAMENGAELVSKRGLGYYLNVHDRSSFEKWQEHINHVLFSYGYNYTENDHYVILILQKFISTDAFITIDQVCDFAICSRQTAIGYLKQVREILADYNLILQSNPHRGLRLTGAEFHKRFLFVELLNSYYDLPRHRSSDISFREFFHITEYEKARRKLLDLLYENHISIMDYFISRMMRFTFLAINRNRAGYPVLVSNEHKMALKESVYYKVCKEFLKDFNLTNEEDEISIMTLNLILCTNSPDPSDSFIQTYLEKSQHYIEELEILFHYQLGMNMESLFLLKIQYFLVQALIKKEFQMSHYRILNKRIEGQMVVNSPYASMMTSLVKNFFENNVNYSMDFYELMTLIALFDSSTEPRYLMRHKLRLLLVGNAPFFVFKNYIDNYLSQYSYFIDEIRCISLFEMHYINIHEYDAVLINHVGISFYHYDIPAIPFMISSENMELTLHSAIRKAIRIGFHIPEELKNFPRVCLIENSESLSDHILDSAMDIAISPEYVSPVYQYIRDQYKQNTQRITYISIPPNLCKEDFIHYHDSGKSRGSVILYSIHLESPSKQFLFSLLMDAVIRRKKDLLSLKNDNEYEDILLEEITKIISRKVNI